MGLHPEVIRRPPAPNSMPAQQHPPGHWLDVLSLRVQLSKPQEQMGAQAQS